MEFLDRERASCVCERETSSWYFRAKIGRTGVVPMFVSER